MNYKIVLLLGLCCCALFGCRSSKHVIRDHESTNNVTVSDSISHVADSVAHVTGNVVVVRSDSVSKDTSFVYRFTQDTLIISDSTYIREFADGRICEYHFHNELRIRTQHDSIYNSQSSAFNFQLVNALRDSVSIYKEAYNLLVSKEKCDSIAFHTTETVVTKKEPWYSRFLEYIKSVCLWLVVLLIAYFVFKKLVLKK